MPQPKRSRATSIKLSRDGVALARFRECTGMDSETEVTEHREGNEQGNPVVRKIPGATKWSNVTLTRALDTSDELWRWRESVLQGNLAQARKDCTIEILDYEGKSIASFQLSRAWPARYSVSLTADWHDEGRRPERSSGDVVLESVVLAHEGFTR